MELFSIRIRRTFQLVSTDFVYNYKRNILFYTYFNVYPKYRRESQARASPSEKGISS